MLPSAAKMPAERLTDAESDPAPVLLAAFTVTVIDWEGEGLAAMLMPLQPAVAVPEPVPGPPPGQTTFVTVPPVTARFAEKRARGARAGVREPDGDVDEAGFVDGGERWREGDLDVLVLDGEEARVVAGGRDAGVGLTILRDES